MNKVLQGTVTTALTAVAVVYALGERAGKAYFANQEQVHEDLAAFYAAFRTGLSTAYNVTYRLGAESRVLFNEYYPVVAPRVTALYNRTVVLHNEVSDYLRGKLQFVNWLNRQSGTLTLWNDLYIDRLCHCDSWVVYKVYK